MEDMEIEVPQITLKRKAPEPAHVYAQRVRDCAPRLKNVCYNGAIVGLCIYNPKQKAHVFLEPRQLEGARVEKPFTVTDRESECKLALEALRR